MQVNCKFNAVAPVAGKTFSALRITLTDASNAVQKQDMNTTAIKAAAVKQDDGSYVLPVTFANVAVGPYTVKAQAVDTSAQPIGSEATGSGTVSMEDGGAWIPSPISFV
jgi:hypothetical protein